MGKDSEVIFNGLATEETEVNNNPYSNLNISGLFGPAGSGKTTLIQRKIAKGDKIRVCCTTGIAAINMGSAVPDQSVATINSTFKYYNTDSLKEAYATGRLQGALLALSKEGYTKLIIDEVSMWPCQQFEIFCMALAEINNLVDVERRGGLKLVLTGDFCQLPPVGEGEKFVFESAMWKYVTSIRKLTKIWRQTNPLFLEALSHGRSGEGASMVTCLRDLEEQTNARIFEKSLIMDYPGTTIFATNKECDRYNDIRLMNLKGNREEIRLTNYKWGEQLGEWDNIPDTLTVCEGCYVMILSNDVPDFTYANGSCGWVIRSMDISYIEIRLASNEEKVSIKRVLRRNLVRHDNGKFGSLPEEPLPFRQWKEMVTSVEEESDSRVSLKEDYKEYLRELTEKYKQPRKPYFDFLEDKWCIGEMWYWPIRIAYGITVYKSQGLTLDKVQIYFNPSVPFFGKPGMSYVALSRIRDSEGMRLVGGSDLIAKRTNVSRRVLEWI